MKNYISSFLDLFSQKNVTKFFKDLAEDKYTPNKYLRILSFGVGIFIVAIKLKYLLVQYTYRTPFVGYRGMDSYYRSDYLSKVYNTDPVRGLTITGSVFLGSLYRHGLSVRQFGVIIQAISFIRLCILSIRFNFPTGLAMTIVSYLAAYSWYMYYVLSFWNMTKSLEQMTERTYTIRSAQELSKMRDYYAGTPTLYNIPGIIFRVVNRTCLYLSKTVGGYYIKYNVDPFSILIRKLDELAIKRLGVNYVGAAYYFTVDYFLPRFGAFISGTVVSYKGMLAYSFFTRRCKNFCPYLIRWHWTMIITCTMTLSNIYPYIFSKLNRYKNLILFPKYDKIADIAYKNVNNFYTTLQDERTNFYSTSDYEQVAKIVPKIRTVYMQIEGVRFFQYVMFAAIISFHLYAALHAACGQYFYIPVITPNAELHTGDKDRTSVYSGGFSAWQEMDKTYTSKRLWYGVFGRGLDKPSIIVVIFDFIKTTLIKMYKFFKD